MTGCGCLQIESNARPTGRGQLLSLLKGDQLFCVSSMPMKRRLI